jgi:putative membrane protein
MFADPNIAAVGSASNQEEIQMSRVALERAQDQRVRTFAQRMIDEHTRVEQEMAAMLQSKGMAPVDNALSLQMKRNLPPKLEMLRGMSGMQFDMGYMMRQIHAHEMTLLSLDTSLIPEADDQALKTYLQSNVRPAVAMHLREAMQLHDQLMMQMQGGANR